MFRSKRPVTQQPLTERPAGSITTRRTVQVNGVNRTWTPNPAFGGNEDKAMLICELAVVGGARLMALALFDRTGSRPHRVELMAYTSNEFTGHTVLWSGALPDEPTLADLTTTVIDKTAAALAYLQEELCPINRRPMTPAAQPISSY